MLERDPTSRVVLSNAASILTRQQAGELGEVSAIQERLARLDEAWGLGSRSATQRIEGNILGAVRFGLLALEVDDGMTQVRDELAVQLIPYGLIDEARIMSATLPETAIAVAVGDAPRALALAQADFEANPSDQDAVIRLAYALALAQQWDETLRLAQVIWEATGRVPTAWPPGTLVEVAWIARFRERTQVYETFAQAARQAIEAREAENTLVERVVYVPTEEQATEVNQFRLGELDWTSEVPSNQFAWLQKNYPEELVVSPWMGSYFFGFNLTREPFGDNPSLRMALILAIDREIITDKVTIVKS